MASATPKTKPTVNSAKSALNGTTSVRTAEASPDVARSAREFLVRCFMAGCHPTRKAYRKLPGSGHHSHGSTSLCAKRDKVTSESACNKLFEDNPQPKSEK